MVQQIVFFLLFLLASLPGFTQDERYYRKLLEGNLTKVGEDDREIMAAQFNVTSARYHIDLDENGIEEIVIPQKRDGVDWIEIQNTSGNKIFEGKLLAMGAESVIYKLRFARISDKIRALIVFLDEGITRGRRFESTGRIFVIGWEGNDLSKMTLNQGPHFFHEKEAQREQYWRRNYNVNVFDVDGDGIREISVQYNNIQRIMKYDKRGEWKRL